MENESTTNTQTLDKAEVSAQIQSAYFTPPQAAVYISQSVSTIYKLSRKRLVPHYKPGGKMIYFKRYDLDKYIKRRRVASIEELNQEASLLIRPRRLRR